MKIYVAAIAACLAFLGTLGVWTAVLVDAHASSRPFYSSVSMGGNRVGDDPIGVWPQPQESPAYYYEFGPYVFPPVLRVQEAPAFEPKQPVPPQPPTASIVR
jgi:hypothetical protein